MAMMAVLLFMTPSLAQDKTVTGKVTDAKGAAIAGVTVKLKGGKALTQTNSSGNFTVKVPAGTTLEFTSVGFNSIEMQVPESGTMSISMTSAKDDLAEVVVIGYGTAKKKDLTGSVVAVSSKDFVKGALTTPEQLIQGKVAGVSITNNGGEPGAGSNIRIRGGASVNASNEPLIVIDGVPLDNGGISGSPNPLSLINPNDIESFNILKDASSAAIYGTRASNGVIIITTKRGKGGKPTFNFSSLFSVYTPSKKLDILSADELRTYVNANAGTAYKSQLGTENIDWQKEIYKTSIGTDNNLSMSGSIFKKVPFRASLGYLNQQGILRTGHLKRATASIVASPKFFRDHLKVDINLKGLVTNSRFANTGAIGAAITANPTQPIYNAANSKYNGYFEWLDAGTDNGLKNGATRNPLGLLNDNYNLSHVERSIGNINFDYKFHFLPDLRLIANIGYDVSRGRGNIDVADSTAQGYNRFKTPDGKLHSGVKNQYLQEKTGYVVDAYLNYTKATKYGDFDVVVGQSYQENKSKTYNFQDYANDGAINNFKTYFADYGLGHNVLVGYYSRLRYSYNDRYFLSVSYRTDGSSRFREGKRWGVFPAGSIAWRISKDLFPNSKIVNDLKLRFGYGKTGQQDGFGDFVYLPNYQPVINQSTYQFGNTFMNTIYTPLAYSTDPNFSWEKTTMYNYGIDFSLFKNRISGYVEYYNRTTTDLLFAANKAGGSQFANIFISNAGTQVNEGVELSFNAQVIKKKDLTFDLGFNINYNKNTITQTSTEPNPNVPGLLTGGISGGVGNTVQIQAVNQPRQSFYVYKQVYDKTGLPLDGVFEDVNRDGTINEKDLVFYKKPDPTVFAGLTVNVGYKKFNFGFVARGSLDNYVYNNVNSNTGVRSRIINSDNVVVNNGSREILKSNLSGKGDKYLLSNYWIENASFIRIDNINVSYNVGKFFNGKANLRLSGNVQNAFVITKYTGLDPEVFGGIDNNIYTRPRVFVLGVNLDF